MSEAEFQWAGNSREMFDELLKGSPLPMRPMVKKALVKALGEQVGAGGMVSEQDVETATRSSTPPPFLPAALKRIAHLKTT